MTRTFTPEDIQHYREFVQRSAQSTVSSQQWNQSFALDCLDEIEALQKYSARLESELCGYRTVHGSGG